MKVKTILCVTVLSLMTLCSRAANGGDRRIRDFVRPPNMLSPFGAHGKTFQYIPVPIVKKVTHHHIHHVIPHQKTENKKYVFEENEGFNGGDVTANVELSKEGNQYEGGLDLGKAAFNAVNKRGGHFGGDLKMSDNSKDGLNDGYAGSGQSFGGIEGLIGDTKAEFVPVVIGLLDEEENQQKSSGGSYSLRDGADGYGFDSGRQGFRNQNFADSNRGANNRYSSRKGLLMPNKSRREYIPPPETLKLFQELARYGW